MKNIRNFCIIAHIDHGKSTLADRLLEYTNTVDKRDMKDQLLDDMDLEKERGITIKSHAVQLNYKFNNEDYILNLIDTPGHVDFSYEVSRSIASCEGALLVIDASQGIQAQTISNLYLALEQGLEIIPVLNKIDLPGSMIEEVSDQIIDLLDCDQSEILHVSAKDGIGIDKIIDQIIKKIPEPKGNAKDNLQAMVFDSVFNSYRGVEVIFRIFNGTIKKGDTVKFVNTKKIYNVDEIGILKIKKEPKDFLEAGNVGYLISGIKEAKEIKVGDTITHKDNPTQNEIKGFEDVKPMVFAGIYPVENSDYEDLRASLEKLQLNDASLVWQPETSVALGFGFRCGFLGMLHMEIIQERLEREFDMTVITTVPSVEFKCFQTDGTMTEIFAPSDMPPVTNISYIEEPIIKAQIITKSEYIGNIIKLCLDKRGIIKNQVYLSKSRVELLFDLPLSEIVFDFYDKLKSTSRGYASFDYELSGYVK